MKAASECLCRIQIYILKWKKLSVVFVIISTRYVLLVLVTLTFKKLMGRCYIMRFHIVCVLFQLIVFLRIMCNVQTKYPYVLPLVTEQAMQRLQAATDDHLNILTNLLQLVRWELVDDVNR